MGIHLLDTYHMAFPDPRLADDEGLVAVGGKISEDWLLLGYESGVFPWFNPGEPILWWSPNPRAVIWPDHIHVQRSMRRVLNRTDWVFKLDTAFERVVERCATSGDRLGRTWISPELKSTYAGLHRAGVGHSAEVWSEGRLIGGLFGVSLGGAFFGESMFSDRTNASKYVMIQLCRWLAMREFHFLDCQVPSPHLSRMGAVDLPRDEFIARLESALDEDTFIGRWKV